MKRLFCDRERSWARRRRHQLRRFLASHNDRLLRLSVCMVFVWFGALKLFPGLSPAETLAGKTIQIMSFGWVPPSLSVPVLGFVEILIGLGLLCRRFLRLTAMFLLLHMIGAAAPVLLLPEQVFVRVPFVLTLEGQYIFKNLVIVTVGIAIGSTMHKKRPLPFSHQSANLDPERV